MKKIIAIICVCFMLLFIDVSADAGNKIRYRRHSSPSFHRKYSRPSIPYNRGEYKRETYKPDNYDPSTYPSYYSPTRGLTSLRLLSFSNVAPVVISIVFWIIILSLYFSFKNKNNKLIDLPTKRFIDEKTIIKKIKSEIFNFDVQQFKDGVKQIFYRLQHAWTAKKWDEMRQYETDELFQMHQKQLEEYIRNQHTNYVEDIQISHCQIMEYEKEGNLQIVKVLLDVSLIDYIVDDSSKQVIEGNKHKRIEHTYVLTLLRNSDKQSNDDEFNQIQCPYCGAINHNNKDGKCNYCGLVMLNEWLLSSID